MRRIVVLLLPGLLAADRPAAVPPPSPPVASVPAAVAWLEAEADRVVRASAVKMADGTTAFPPQVGGGYDAFWLRDFAYALDGSGRSVTAAELTAACRVFVGGVAADGAAVDCVRFDGSPVYKPGFGKLGREAVLDGPPFTVAVVWHTFRRTRDGGRLRADLPVLDRAMRYVPRNPATGLPTIADPAERCSYGFTDSIKKAGDDLFCSLLMIEAAGRLAELHTAAGRPAAAAAWREDAARLTAGVRRVFWDDAVGLFRSTTRVGNVPDIWGSAFAVSTGVATAGQTARVAAYFRDHYAELVVDGQVRHLPGFTAWDGSRTAANSGDYQSGGFWGTPAGWFADALDRADPALADRTVIDLVRHYQRYGACEWINRDGKRQLPGYTASAALPLDGFRRMLARRAESATAVTPGRPAAAPTPPAGPPAAGGG